MVLVELIVTGNIVTAAAYYLLTAQLLLFVRSKKFTSIFATNGGMGDEKKSELFYLMIAVAGLFATFIFMCGNTHTMNVVHRYFPESNAVVQIQVTIMIACAVVSILTAIAALRIFPIILDMVGSFELNEDGKLQRADQYLIEAVEMIKESIMILSDDLVILRGNDASRLFFGNQAVNNKITDFIHPKDLRLFHETVTRVMGSYNFTPATIEVRIKREPQSPASVSSPISCSAPFSRASTSPTNQRRASANRVYCGDDSPSRRSLASNSGPESPRSANRTHSTPSYANTREVDDDGYIWIECTLCKGARMNRGSEFEYDVKMVARNIDDRKKRAQYQTMIESTEEKERINESKMRYISCIAHDLKTPLQSFCFTMDLLGQTRLHTEQRDFVQQALVAVDLMKLTISQTMDISKALTGAKLLPRRTTVYLSSVIQRVKVIINGYSKQVPVSFEVAPDVCDAVITDEEWLWQMLLNLLTNACKYTDHGIIEMRLSVTSNPAIKLSSMSSDATTVVQNLLPESRSTDMLLCEVIDTGIGIHPSKIAHIFDAFAQVQDGQATGTGLGLFGVRTRAEGLSGTCGARHNTTSPTGTGTVLWFAIPYLPDVSLSPTTTTRTMAMPGGGQVWPFTSALVNPPFDEQPEHLSSDATVSDPYLVPSPDDPNQRTAEFIRRRQLTAILVEDTLTVRKLMEKLLRNMGFARVDCYENGSKGLDAMMAGQVDIVFSDVQMPIMTGPEMVSRFRTFEAAALGSGTRTARQLVVAVTANGAQSGQIGEMGFDEVCPKPLHRNDIYNVVNKHLHALQ